MILHNYWHHDHHKLLQKTIGGCTCYDAGYSSNSDWDAHHEHTVFRFWLEFMLKYVNCVGRVFAVFDRFGLSYVCLDKSKQEATRIEPLYGLYQKHKFTCQHSRNMCKQRSVITSITYWHANFFENICLPFCLFSGLGLHLFGTFLVVSIYLFSS